MRRVVPYLRNLNNVRSLDAVALSPLGSRIPLVSLIYALAVAEHLNFRHAASALRVSQSCVSARIKHEQDTGTLLFERRHHGVRLTEAGQYFLEHVATGIENLDHAVRTAGAISRGEQGRLRIGLYASIAAGFLAELLGQFRELHPASICRLQKGEPETPFKRYGRGGLTSPLWSACRRLAIAIRSHCGQRLSSSRSRSAILWPNRKV